MACPFTMSKLEEKLSQRLDKLGIDTEVNVEDDVEMGNEGKGNVICINADGKQVDVVPAFAVTMDQVKERIAMLQQFIREYMIPGQDFGVIPGCKRPSLFKAGAEKLSDVFGLSKRAEVTSRMENWEEGLFSYEVRVTLIDKRSGKVEAEGFGSCNNREKKYATQDAYNLPNTLLKMAKKRAMIDAVLSATRSSGIFGQDLEDIDFSSGNRTGETYHPQTQQIRPKVPNNNGSNKATSAQLKTIYALAKQLSLTSSQAKEMLRIGYQVGDSRDLTKMQADGFIKRLQQLLNGNR